jgi:hypothetical protein
MKKYLILVKLFIYFPFFATVVYAGHEEEGSTHSCKETDPSLSQLRDIARIGSSSTPSQEESPAKRIDDSMKRLKSHIDLIGKPEFNQDLIGRPDLFIGHLFI